MTEDNLICARHGLPNELGPDPYAQEINNDDSDYWECSVCRDESADDI